MHQHSGLPDLDAGPVGQRHIGDALPVHDHAVGRAEVFDADLDLAVGGLFDDHAGVLAGIATKTRAAADAVRAYERQTGLALAAADKKNTEDLNNAKAETQRLRDCVRAGTCGVRIVTRYADQPDGAGPADAATGGVGDDAITLDASVSERVLDLRDAIAEDQAKLEYLQQYADQCKELGGESL